MVREGSGPSTSLGMNGCSCLRTLERWAQRTPPRSSRAKSRDPSPLEPSPMEKHADLALGLDHQADLVAALVRSLFDPDRDALVAVVERGEALRGAPGVLLLDRGP